MPLPNTPPPLFDTHAHLDEPSLLADQRVILELARESGLVGILTIGTTLASSRQSMELAASEELIHAAVGIHPNYVSQTRETDWPEIERIAESPRVVAIGETGLDHYWKHTPIDQQIDYFERHLALSARLGKPFIVHCRDADDDVLRVLERQARTGPLEGVMHSFCGGEEMARQCVDWGMMISFSGMLSFKRNDELRHIARGIPRDRILIETDSPYLAPIPFRGKRNQPAYVKHTAEVLATTLGLSYAETCALTTANALRFLHLPPLESPGPDLAP